MMTNILESVRKTAIAAVAGVLAFAAAYGKTTPDTQWWEVNPTNTVGEVLADIGGATTNDVGGISEQLYLLSNDVYQTIIDERNVVLRYGQGTWSDFTNALARNAIIYCDASNKSDNPGQGGTDRRMAFLAYHMLELAEFQYYRSVASHSDEQQNDQVIVYTLSSNSTWSVSVREAGTAIVAGDGLQSAYQGGTLTISANLTNYATKADATLTERTGFTDWDIVHSPLSNEQKEICYAEDPTSADNNYAVRIAEYSGEGEIYVGEHVVAAVTISSDGQTANFSGGTSAGYYIWGPVGSVAATRTALQGYQLGSDTNHILAAQADFEAATNDLSESVAAVSSNLETNYYTIAQTDDAIDALAAYYITADAQGSAFATLQALTNASAYYSGGVARSPTRNDYAVVLADETHGGAEYRYIFAVADGATTGQWEAQYPIETNDYEALSNKPQINGVSLTGNKTGADLGVLDLSGGTMTGNLDMGTSPLTVGTVDITVGDSDSQIAFVDYYGNTTRLVVSENQTVAYSSQVSAAALAATNYTDAATNGFIKVEEDPTVPDWAKSETQPLPPDYAAVSNLAYGAATKADATLNPSTNTTLWTIYRDGIDITSQVSSQPVYDTAQNQWYILESILPGDDTEGNWYAEGSPDSVSLEWLSYTLDEITTDDDIHTNKALRSQLVGYSLGAQTNETLSSYLSFTTLATNVYPRNVAATKGQVALTEQYVFSIWKITADGIDITDEVAQPVWNSEGQEWDVSSSVPEDVYIGYPWISGDGMETELQYAGENMESSKQIRFHATRERFVGYQLGQNSFSRLASLDSLCAVGTDLFTNYYTKAEAATKADATLTTRAEFSEWTIYRDGVDVTSQVAVMPSYDAEYPGWYVGDSHIAGDEEGDSYAGSDSTDLRLWWGCYRNNNGDVTYYDYHATRYVLPGYVLGSDTNHILASQVQVDSIVSNMSQKANLVSSPTNGNFVAMDGSGNLVNSGRKDLDFVHTTALSGNTYDFNFNSNIVRAVADIVRALGGTVTNDPNN